MKYHAYLDAVRVLVREAAGHPVQLGGIVSLEFRFATKDERKWGMPKTTKPDCDNLTKAFCDALAKNDAHVWHQTASKYWGQHDEIIIHTGIEHQRDAARVAGR
jgi:Holliday junction resolvase RusA-like endonuclease